MGSSFDPDMEDPERWENELHSTLFRRGVMLYSHDHGTEPSPVSTEPEDVDEEEIAAYAAEAELNLDDLHPEDIFSLSDLDDVLDEDVDMH